jgi:hypothetical protein
LGPIGGRDKAIEAGEFQQQTDQANATGADFRAHQVDSKHKTMQEGKTWSTLEKGHDGRVFIKTFLIGPPRLKRATGNLKCLGGLTQGEALSLQIEILIEAFSASGAIPPGGAISIASGCGLDYGCHGDLLV